MADAGSRLVRLTPWKSRRAGDADFASTSSSGKLRGRVWGRRPRDVREAGAPQLPRVASADRSKVQSPLKRRWARKSQRRKEAAG